jgi:hypothetical protein
LAVTSIFTVSVMQTTHTRVAATSALGSVVGTAVGKQIGGNTGAMIGSAVGGAGGAAASTNRNDRTAAAIGGGLGGVGGIPLVKIWVAPLVAILVLLGAAGGSVLVKKYLKTAMQINVSTIKSTKKTRRHH